MGYGIVVEVTGPRACFSRVEFKAERVSYDVMTPSAARGILESVYWKPAIRWVIDSIDVISPIVFDTFRRNEVGSKVSYTTARKVEKASRGHLGISAADDRQQRATMYLRNVRYIITAHFEMTQEAGESDSPEKHYNMALRRLRKGQCFNQPYLGCREFAVDSIRLIEDGAIPESCFKGEERDLGFMLYDIDFENEMKPLFFRALMRDGRIDVASAREEVMS